MGRDEQLFIPAVGRRKDQQMRSFHGKGRSLLLGAALALAAPGASRAADEGEKVYQETCTNCHGPSTRPLDDVRMTRAEWKDAIERMEGQGAQIPSGKKLAAILDWLERTHGPASPAPQKSAPADKK
jgi:mono/diheme cytochrome c family protein